MNAHSSASSSARQPTQTRRLSILRHAKAAEGDGDDHARKLNDRGAKDATRMGAFITQKSMIPELVICSTAARTRTTLAALNLDVPTMLAARAYLASPGELLSLIQESDDAVQHILLIGHNPGLHALVAALAGEYAHQADEQLIGLKFPTCTFASLQLPIPRWKDLKPGAGRLEIVAIGSKL